MTGEAPDYNEFYDPRLVAVYDTVNPIHTYEAFYLGLASRLGASSILDVGCGSGLLTCALAARGHALTGLDPSAGLLELARRRCPDVTWLHGYPTHLPSLNADLAVLTGHVAQFFLEDSDWQAALRAIQRALRPGGYLAFECRNPLVQPYFGATTTHDENWMAPDAIQRVTDPVAGDIEWWSELQGVDGRRVRYDIHYRFLDSGEELVSGDELCFRSRDEIGRSLHEAGFGVEYIYGDWDGSPASNASPEMIFLAKRI